MTTLRCALLRLGLAGFIGLNGANGMAPTTPFSDPSARRDVAAAELRVREAATRAGMSWPLRPRIVVAKSERRLELWSGDTFVKSYRIALGNEPHLDKEREGDHRTPEGEFYVCTRNDRSRFHLFLGLSYPSPEDAARGLQAGLVSRSEHRRIVDAHRRRARPPWNTGLGGEVGIHGGGTDSDWTWGCIALSNADIEELWSVCTMGTPVQILR